MRLADEFSIRDISYGAVGAGGVGKGSTSPGRCDGESPSTSKSVVRRRNDFLRQTRKRNTPRATSTPRKTKAPAIVASRVAPEKLLELDAFALEFDGGTSEAEEVEVDGNV